MDFDTLTVVTLLTPENPRELTDAERDALQDSHLAHLADLHAAGILLAAGPTDGGSRLRPVRGFAILTVEPAKALALMSEDAAVTAGVFTLEAVAWMVPSGALSFAPTLFPRSMSDVAG